VTGEFLRIKKTLPQLGIGLGLRPEIYDQTLAARAAIDWLELAIDNYIRVGGKATAQLEAVASRFPVVSHGVELSLGSTDDVSYEYLKAVKKALDRVEAPWWSDHLCFSGVDGFYLHDLLPLPFSREAVNHVVERIRRAQGYVERPFLIENITYYMHMPGGEMSEAQFLAEVLEKADCGLLLDVNNVYVNSVNLGYDPVEFLRAIPIERTVQIHVAGHNRQKGLLVDTHGMPVIEPVYRLLEEALGLAEAKAVMLERDQNFPDFPQILSELARIRRLFDNAHRSRAASAV
jgi:uncharacterized protein (UPF0276 family)